MEQFRLIPAEEAPPALSILSMSSAAESVALLTQAELRTAIGATTGENDTALAAIEAKVADAIMAECNIAVVPGYAPTLRRETVVQTIYRVRRDFVILARRHDVEITSVVEDGITLDASAYLVEAESGFLHRLETDGMPKRWCADKLVITYAAGFSTVPAALKQAASDFVRLSWLERNRDPALKSERIDVYGVDETERQYWVGAVPGQAGESAVPEVVSGQLKRFRRPGVA